ncbi:unnamed protein product [Protopolystoma xenopodis]|uniref:Uncharacterized protein n=1 Tax=Protopolystoma xenopodis TaxID=117903 RepID=A0A448X0Y6_9PLAT|nr:unnamed protein product [Protopolystoma xenopodis]
MSGQTGCLIPMRLSGTSGTAMAEVDAAIAAAVLSAFNSGSVTGIQHQHQHGPTTVLPTTMATQVSLALLSYENSKLSHTPIHTVFIAPGQGYWLRYLKSFTNWHSALVIGYFHTLENFTVNGEANETSHFG